MVTGESMPAPKGPGYKIIGGTLNGTCSLVMHADTVGAGGMLSRIVAMVSEVQRREPAPQDIVEWHIVVSRYGQHRGRQHPKEICRRLEFNDADALRHIARNHHELRRSLSDRAQKRRQNRVVNNAKMQV